MVTHHYHNSSLFITIITHHYSPSFISIHHYSPLYPRIICCSLRCLGQVPPICALPSAWRRCWSTAAAEGPGSATGRAARGGPTMAVPKPWWNASGWWRFWWRGWWMVSFMVKAASLSMAFDDQSCWPMPWGDMFWIFEMESWNSRNLTTAKWFHYCFFSMPGYGRA